MHEFNQPASPLTSFGVIKQILLHFGVSPDSAGELARSLRIFWPLDQELAERVRAGTTSLTDAATSQEQIRFFQRHRARRSYIKVASAITETHRPLSLRIGNCKELDEPSWDFLTTAADVCQWEVEYQQSSFETDTSEFSSDPSENTSWQRLVDAPATADQLNELWSSAFEYINVGDAWSGTRLGRIMMKHEQSPRVWNLLALGYAMLQESENAEFYYRKWAEDGGNLDKVRAHYGISMLYARHHPDGLRSLPVAAEHLETAYAILQSFEPEHRDEDTAVFEEVFNRNGYALTLFRKGQVDEALALLKWGIDSLGNTGEKVAVHRSVLMYNLAQCYRQLGERDEAIQSYARLVEVDPYMPEYRFEAAKCYADIGDFTSAANSVKDGLRIDDSLDVGWSLLGVYQQRSGDVDSADESFGIAHRLNPRHPPHCLDYAYTQLLQGRPDSSRMLLTGLRTRNQAEAERKAALLAESWLKSGQISKSLEILEAAVDVYPQSTALQTNINSLRHR